MYHIRVLPHFDRRQSVYYTPRSAPLRPQRTFARNLIVPAWPGRSVPGNSHRKISDPTSFAAVVKFAGRSVTAEPGTYSSRPLRLSLTTRSDTGFAPVLA